MLWVVLPVDVALFVIIRVCVKQKASEVIQKQYADQIRQKIRDDSTHDDEHYGISRDKHKLGTTNVSVLDEYGMAVSVTSSINYM